MGWNRKTRILGRVALLKKLGKEVVNISTRFYNKRKWLQKKTLKIKEEGMQTLHCILQELKLTNPSVRNPLELAAYLPLFVPEFQSP